MSAALLELARATGREAAAFVAAERLLGRVDVAATKSTLTDVVTAVDEACERLIRGRLLGERPGDGFLGEEGDEVVGTSGVRWVVDPIDGTVNFIYGIPAYAVAIAAVVDDAVVAGHVINVVTGEEWGAVRGEGAWRYDGDGRRVLAAPRPESLATALVATGFSYSAETRVKQARALVGLIPHVRDVRRIGSAALDLCGLAEGRVDAYVEQGLKPWDLAAAGLVASEAGLVLSGLDGPPDERLVMAIHPGLAQEYFDLVRACGF